MSERAALAVQDRFNTRVIKVSQEFGNDTVVLKPSVLFEAAKFLRDAPDLAFDMPIDCSAVDWMNKRKHRFSVCWHLYSTQHHHRLRLTVELPADEPSCASLTPLWPGMDWHERETWDMYGIRFEGHHNLKRVLMYEEFVGFPLRKDYPIDKRQPLIELNDVEAVATQRHAPADMLNAP